MHQSCRKIVAFASWKVSDGLSRAKVSPNPVTPAHLIDENAAFLLNEAARRGQPRPEQTTDFASPVNTRL